MDDVAKGGAYELFAFQSTCNFATIQKKRWGRCKSQCLRIGDWGLIELKGKALFDLPLQTKRGKGLSAVEESHRTTNHNYEELFYSQQGGDYCIFAKL
jgi:hypothetical protein